jgi:hypothetical protein
MVAVSPGREPITVPAMTPANARSTLRGDKAAAMLSKPDMRHPFLERDQVTWTLKFTVRITRNTETLQLDP